MIFPFIIFNFFSEIQDVIFPDIETSQDLYGLFAFLIYMIIHLAVIRIFIVQDNSVILVSLFSIGATLGGFVLWNQFIIPLIVFVQAENFIFNIEVANLIGLILLYDVLFIIIANVLRPRN